MVLKGTDPVAGMTVLPADLRTLLEHEFLGKLLLAVGYRVAQADKMPEWKPGNEFKSKRDAMLKK